MFVEEIFFLSPLYRSKMVIDYVIYDSAEHYYQSEKFAGSNIMAKIIKADTPDKARKIALSEEANNPSNIADNWNKTKSKTMKKALTEKFFQNKKLGQSLLRIEGYIGDPSGENKLGKTLMSVRNDLGKFFGVRVKNSSPKKSKDKNEEFIRTVMEKDTFDPKIYKGIVDKYMNGECEALSGYLAQINDYKGEIVKIRGEEEGFHSVYSIGGNFYDIRGKFDSIGELVLNVDYLSEGNIYVEKTDIKEDKVFLKIPNHLSLKAEVKIPSSIIDQDQDSLNRKDILKR